VDQESDELSFFVVLIACLFFCLLVGYLCLMSCCGSDYVGSFEEWLMIEMSFFICFCMCESR
jgi:hypothetical protein